MGIQGTYDEVSAAERRRITLEKKKKRKKKEEPALMAHASGSEVVH